MLNRNQLKIFMLLLMTLDHINLFVSGETATLFHALTRPVAVFFAYMLVEGFKYTRNSKKYLSRLWIWALIMALGNFILNYFIKNVDHQVQNNIFLTLAVAGTMIFIIQERVKYELKTYQSILITIGLILIFFAGIALTEGGIVVLPFTLITYFTRNNWKLRDLSYIIFSLLLFLSFTLPSLIDSQTAREFWLNFGFNSDWLFILVIPFLHLYNGKKGSDNTFYKYLFYIYYPAHLWIIAILAEFIK